MILGLNCGFYNTKVRIANERYVYSTKIQEIEDGCKTLRLGNTTYEIGIGTRDISDKQLNKVHERCTEYSILKYAPCEVTNLIVALPMNLYLNKGYRADYKERLIGIHRGIVDKVDKRVHIRDCVVFAEGAAAYLPHKSILKDKVVGILDFGGNTINCMIYDHGSLLKETISTLDLGMIKLERAIIDELNTKNNWNVQEYEVREILDSGECKNHIERCILSHLNEIKQRLLEKKWNIDRLTIFATGGGSVQLKGYLEKTFNRIILSQNGLWDNVDGLWLVGGEIYGKKAY